MALFPTFIDLSKKRILLIGAGYVAARKAEKLLLFVPQIDCVATFAREEISAWVNSGKINFKQKTFEMEDLVGYDLIIAAIDNFELQETIFQHCEKQNLLCNCVDSPEYCNFIFPSLIVREDLVIGISTSGKAPSVASAIRERIERSLPENLSDIIKNVQQLRKTLKSQGLTTSERGLKIIKYVKSQFDSLL